MHVVPSGLGGAFSWTNCCCSVSGSGPQFSYTCNGTCLCGGCTADGVYVYEGYCIGCSGGWCGCAWGETDHYGDDDDPSPVSGISVSFSERAVIFEDGYENTPGSWVARRSTRVTLTCAVHGGMKGGTATFACTNLEKLDGGVLPPTVVVPAGRCITYEIGYSGRLPSGGADDIVVRGTFVENNAEPGTAPLTSESKLTSVRVELEAVYVAPENASQSRHVYGVGEKVKLMHSPQSVGLTWGKIPDDIWSDLESGNGCDNVLKLHYLGGTITGVVATFNGVDYQPSISVCEPQEVVCRRWEWDGECSPKGSAGGFGMKLWLYIGPMHVSFQGIDVAEIPCNTIIPPTGYYATTNFNGVLSHTIAAGAGYWHHVATSNYWCRDDAKSNLRRPKWSAGRMIWNIPIQWYQRLESSESWTLGTIHSDGRLIGGAEDVYTQTFEMFDDGTITVSKHTHWIERTTNDVIRIDGATTHNGEH